jgi:protein TonB
MRLSLIAIYGASFVFHAGLAVVFASIEPPPVMETVRIELRDPPPVEEPPEVEEPPPPPEPETPPPPVAEAPPPPPRPQAEPPPPPPQAPAPPPMLGASMQGGVGAGGIALPAGSTQAPAAQPEPVVRRAERTLEAAPEPERQAAESGCAEEASRPRPISMPQPAYTDEARTATIEGRVRVRIEVDATGAVSNVEVLEGLGHGLDEAAIEAVRGARFDPALRCGEAVSATFTISVRFTL